MSVALRSVRSNDAKISQVFSFLLQLQKNFTLFFFLWKITVKVIIHGGNKTYSYEVMQIEVPIT